MKRYLTGFPRWRPLLALGTVLLLLLAACSPDEPTPQVLPITPPVDLNPLSATSPAPSPGGDQGVGPSQPTLMTPGPAPATANAAQNTRLTPELGAGTVIPKTQGSVTLTLWHDWAPSTVAVLQQALAEYHQSHPNVTVNLVAKDDPAAEVLTAVPQGKGPDLFVASASRTGELADSAIILPIDTLLGQTPLAHDYEPIAVAAVQYTGNTWAVPLSLSSATLIYNKALISPADVPADVETLIQRADAYQKANPGKYYFVYAGAGNAFLDASWLYGAGGYYLDTTPSVGINTPGGIQGLTLVSRLRKLMPANFDYNQVDQWFKAGSVAMTINEPEYLGELGKMDIGVANIPALAAGGPPSKPLVDTTALFVTPNSTAPDIAVDVARYLSGNAISLRLVQSSLWLPANKPAADALIQRSLGFAGPLMAQARQGAQIPNQPEMSFLFDPISRMWDDIWLGQDPAAVAAQAQATCEAALKAQGVEPQPPKRK